MLNLKKYQRYFHDGKIKYIFHDSDHIEIWMHSCEISEYFDLDDPIPLSKERTITGKLYLEQVTEIYVREKPINILVQSFDLGIIWEMIVKENHVTLYAEWRNLLPKRSKRKPYGIEVFAKKNLLGKHS